MINKPFSLSICQGAPKRFHLTYWIVLLILIPGLTACDSDSTNTDTVQAAMSVNNRIDSTGGVFLDINDAVFSTDDDVTHSVTVSDAETGDVIHEIVDTPYDDINNGHIEFFPFGDDLELGVVHQLRRKLNIDYAIKHANGTVDTLRHSMDIDEELVFDSVGTTPPTQVVAQINANALDIHEKSHPFSVSLSCIGTCSSPRGSHQVICTMDVRCQSVVLNSDGTNDLLDLANKVATHYQYDAITLKTSVWLQAGGGYGGRSKKNRHHSHGGVGGVAHTVTTLEDIIRVVGPTDSEPKLYYYAARTGDHGISGSGGPGTLVVKHALFSAITDIKDIFLIAGGGGGGSTTNDTQDRTGGHGGAGGIARAVIDDVGLGIGANGGGKTGGEGGSFKHENGQLIGDGGDGGPSGHSGADGYGGDSGRKQGWLTNSTVVPNIGDDGRGGHSNSQNDLHAGGGGGGFGGGASGDAHKAGGGGGAGSYGRLSTHTDPDAPTLDSELESLRSSSNGWVRFVFNTTRKKN